MAEVTAFRNNALPYPVYGVPWTIVFPILDADGDPVTGATCDSEVSKNGDTGADCTNEGTEITFTTATNKGMYYLTLTATEMTADIVAITIYPDSGKATCISLYPRKLVSLATGTSQGGAAGYITLAAATVAFDGQYNGCLCVATIDTNIEARILQACTSADQQCTVTPEWNVNPDSDDTYILYLPEGRQIPESNVNALSDDAAAAGELKNIFNGTGGPMKLTSLEVTGTTTLTGAVSLGSTLGITGAVTLSSTLGVGAVTFASAAITGALSVGTTTTLTGAVSLGSTLAVAGTTTLTGAVSLGSTLGVAGAATFTSGIVANITGSLSGSVGSLTGHTVQTGDTYALANGAAGFSAINTDVEAILLDTGTTLPATLSTIDGIVDAIAGYIDTEIASIYSRLGAPAGASMSADVAALKAETALILADTGSDGVVIAAASKTGMKLASDGLDSISAAEVTTKPTTFARWFMWLVQRFRKSTLTADTLTVQQEDGTTVTEQAVSDDGTTQDLGAPS